MNENPQKNNEEKEEISEEMLGSFESIGASIEFKEFQNVHGGGPITVEVATYYAGSGRKEVNYAGSDLHFANLVFLMCVATANCYMYTEGMSPYPTFKA
jgi:hypothetical protein